MLSILVPITDHTRRDAVDNFLRSLQATLGADAFPFEVIACSDGSADDILRAWSDKKWRDGRPFLQLISQPHPGNPAQTANFLARHARGGILAFLETDALCLTELWASRLAAVFDADPEKLAVVGPRQLFPDMTIRAQGEIILHPNGPTPVAQGLSRTAAKRPVEADHVSGAFYCCRKSLFDQLAGFDEKFAADPTLDFSLRARLAGYRCLAVPDIEYVHARLNRIGGAQAVAQWLQTFEDKWGFSPLVPDLDLVRARYAGTPLLWNKKWLAGQTLPARHRSTQVETGAWVRFSHDPAYQNMLKYRASVVLEVIQQAGPPRRLVQVGAGQGLLLHMLANSGVNCLGFDPSASDIDLARRFIQPQKYPGPRPAFDTQPNPSTIPLPDAQTDLLVIVDLLETLPNPVALLKEARRVLAPGKHLLVISQRRALSAADPTDPTLVNDRFEEHRYLWPELLAQIHHMGGFRVLVNPSADDPKRDMAVVAGRTDEFLAHLPISSPAGASALSARPIAPAA